MATDVAPLPSPACSPGQSSSKVTTPEEAGSGAESGGQGSEGPTSDSPPTSPDEALSPDDLQLLAKLEEQNRLLESDSKLLAFSGSRRNSGASLVSSSSGSSGQSHGEEEAAWPLWGQLVAEWEETTRKGSRGVKELVRKGIPHHFRGIAWQLLCGAQALPVKAQYSDLLKTASPCERLIRRDIARTYPEHGFFRQKDSLGQEVLFNVMKAYSLVDPEVGYCQGSAFIVGLLLMQMPEEDAFCVFVKLMQEYRLRELFKPSMAELGLCMYQLENLIQEQLPELNVHFQAQSFHTTMYASSWFLTLFLTTFPLPLATRIFDIFLSEGLDIVFHVGLAVLQAAQSDLLQLDMEGMLQYFQKSLPHMFDNNHDRLINLAFQVKYNPRKMRRLEREYNTQRSKEIQEQVEMKRLRTENRLLRQRVENLEKGQVIRAQESEEASALRREGSQLRQRLSQCQGELKKKETELAWLSQELEQKLCCADLKQEALQATLKAAQDRAAELERQGRALPDESNVARLTDEVRAARQREASAVSALEEMQEAVQQLQREWKSFVDGAGKRKAGHTAAQQQQEVLGLRFSEAQNEAELKITQHHLRQLQIESELQSSRLERAEKLAEKAKEDAQRVEGERVTLLSRLEQAQRRLAEAECRNKEEVMAVRLREVDGITAVLELQQRVAELEIQKEERQLQLQLEGNEGQPSMQALTAKIHELQTEVARLGGESGLDPSMTSPSSDEEFLSNPSISLLAENGCLFENGDIAHNAHSTSK
uniref:Rab-GAP TBC domain-containing protein n=1 Tax=Eptatretus burgeri TaxID=7764 RepID=A0A8C4Q8E2_EPTBU